MQLYAAPPRSSHQGAAPCGYRGGCSRPSGTGVRDAIVLSVTTGGFQSSRRRRADAGYGVAVCTVPGLAYRAPARLAVGSAF